MRPPKPQMIESQPTKQCVLASFTENSSEPMLLRKLPIHVDSKPGQGTTVILTVPAIDSAPVPGGPE